ncbi:inhibitor of the pro-sigma K processing machinery [Seinonella peptonophila]|uniref:Inhibitor of the pro-sigma K processing machinery n=1 Tax=Seinonella peptonophila TaxID=112248 RepID=A0A1M4XB21_9BACL|nr:pro-sigmaK processing inhibitor BofA family protein [Seinonella peptonophila]SHE90633.1 inhibitor of the pro-sigma K processing machinery [Seinonella peptonophila]
MLDIKWWLFIAVLGVILIMVISRSITKPLGWLWYCILYSAAGAIVLFLLNLIGQHFQIEVPINPLSALIAGGLGIPGVAFLVASQLMIF